MTANIIVEQTPDGYFSCFVKEEIPYVGLLGYGESSESAIDSLIEFYHQSKAELAAEGKILPELDFTVHYDMPSFFNRFNFLNQSKIAERAGINPSLMRKYTSGVAKAGQKQYDKLHAAVQSLAREMLAAAF
ncbi:MAG: pilus assembly protein HicB [Muribaculaceae bacterium]|nr:pilus assembly protein HicB [Muribaculaceae bacterium]